MSSVHHLPCYPSSVFAVAEISETLSELLMSTASGIGPGTGTRAARLLAVAEQAHGRVTRSGLSMLPGFFSEQVQSGLQGLKFTQLSWD